MTEHDDNEPKYLVIPPEKLTEDVRNAFIHEFILREGTDYGSVEYSLDQKTQHILKQLNANHILFVYDIELESTSIMTKDRFKAVQSGQIA